MQPKSLDESFTPQNAIIVVEDEPKVALNNEKIKKISRTIPKTIHDNLEITLSEKIYQVHSSKSASGSTEEEGKVKKGFTQSIEKTYSLFEKCFESGNFKKAASYYESVDRLQRAKTYFRLDSFGSIVKKLYLCHIELWKNETDVEKKYQWILKANKDLENYLNSEKSLETKTAHHLDFAALLFNTAIELINENRFLSFNYFKLLLQLDLKYPEHLSADFDELMDLILDNMTVCISNQEQVEEGSSDSMRDELKTLLLDPIKAKRQVYYRNWLNQAWDRTPSANNPKTSDKEQFAVQITKKVFEQRNLREIAGESQIYIIDDHDDITVCVELKMDVELESKNSIEEKIDSPQSTTPKTLNNLDEGLSFAIVFELEQSSASKKRSANADLDKTAENDTKRKKS